MTFVTLEGWKEFRSSYKEIYCDVQPNNEVVYIQYTYNINIYIYVYGSFYYINVQPKMRLQSGKQHSEQYHQVTLLLLSLCI